MRLVQIAHFGLAFVAMEQAVREELDGLLEYARAVKRFSADAPHVVAPGHAYVGGAMTTLLHLKLLTAEEHSEWWDRLREELPPQNEVSYPA